MMADYDPYRDGFRVLDTDYESFLIVYHCSHNEQEEEHDPDAGIDVQLQKAKQHLANYARTKHVHSDSFNQF